MPVQALPKALIALLSNEDSSLHYQLDVHRLRRLCRRLQPERSQHRSLEIDQHIVSPTRRTMSFLNAGETICRKRDIGGLSKEA